MSVELRLPQMSDTMEKATVVRWLKTAGDAITAGEIIAELETDKAGVELEAPVSGLLARILVPAGTEDVPVGELLAVIDEASAEGQPVTPSSSVESRAPTTVAQGETAASDTNDDKTVAEEPALTTVAMTPLGEAMAAIAGISPASVATSGRVTRMDVERALGLPAITLKTAAAPARDETARLVPHNTVRKLIASRLTEAKQKIPHFYLSIDCDVGPAMELLQRLNEGDVQPRLSLTSLIIRAAVAAIHRVPAVNVEWTPSHVVIRREVNIAVGVQTPSGLVAPVIKDAHRMALLEIASKLHALVTRATEARLRAEDTSGGTFTISNLGMFGVDSLFAIISPGQSCVLGTGACRVQAVVRDGAVVPGKRMTATLSADHRALDGADGAKFLRTFREMIEEPAKMLL